MTLESYSQNSGDKEEEKQVIIDDLTDKTALGDTQDMTGQICLWVN